MDRKTIIDQKPNSPRLPKDIAQGKRNAISRSNIINNILLIQYKVFFLACYYLFYLLIDAIFNCNASI